MADLGNNSVFAQADASNASGTMPSWSGAAAPSTLDDAGRALQGAVTREWNWRNFTLTAGGTADAKTLTYSTAPAAYYNGQRFAFIANTTNTTSATLNVNGLGAKTIKSMATGTLTNLSASNMVAGEYVEVAYNLANDCFVWVNQSDILPQALGTGDSPQFAGVNIGDASDTTLTRASAGVLAVEGGVIPKENRANTFAATQAISVSSPNILSLTSSTVNGGYMTVFTDNGTTPSYIGSHKGIYTTGNATDLALYATNNMTLGTNGSERLRVDTSGNVGIGGASTGAKLEVIGDTTATFTRMATAAGVADIGAVRNDFFTGPSYSGSILRFWGASATGTTLGAPNANAGHLTFQNSALGAIYTNGAAPLLFGTTSSERMRIDASGNVLVTSSGGLGYGTGSGGTVTQITSKATGVTINKTNGQIITHNASLGAASEVSFTVTNSTVAATDNIILTKVSGGTATRYQLYVGAVAAGSFVVSIRNVDSTAQSDVITFNFAVIKSVTS